MAPLTTGAPTSAIVPRTSSRIVRDPGSSALSPQIGQIGRVLPQRLVKVQVEPRHRDVSGLPGPPADPFPEVDLDRGHVDRPTRCSGERDHGGAEDGRDGENHGGAPGARAVRFDGLGDQRGRERHRERHAEDTGDDGQTHGDRVGHLRGAERPPREAAERPQPAEPIDRGPQRCRPHRRQERVAGPPDEGEQGAEQRDRQGGEDGQRAPCERAEELEPRQGEPEPHETEREPQGEPAGGRRPPEREEQQRGGEERERPGGHGREGEREQHATDQGEGERDRQPAIGQAQSRQNIRRLSASWLRCFTR